MGYGSGAGGGSGIFNAFDIVKLLKEILEELKAIKRLHVECQQLMKNNLSKTNNGKKQNRQG